ncbi:MAG: histidine phosphatase family protein [Pseudomonadota bacterium]
MKKLILLRHAKSSWKDAQLSDHDRPLNKRGQQASPVIASWLMELEHAPDHVFCSTSVRTRETYAMMQDVMTALPAAEYSAELYHAAPDTMLDLIRTAPKDAECVMLVGHQPGLGAMTRVLSRERATRRCERAFQHFPTAAAAVLEFDVEDWGQVDYAMAKFVDFAMPRELMDA